MSLGRADFSTSARNQSMLVSSYPPLAILIPRMGDLPPVYCPQMVKMMASKPCQVGLWCLGQTPSDIGLSENSPPPFHPLVNHNVHEHSLSKWPHVIISYELKQVHLKISQFSPYHNGLNVDKTQEILQMSRPTMAQILSAWNASNAKAPWLTFFVFQVPRSAWNLQVSSHDSVRFS